MTDHDDTELADPGGDHTRVSACPEMPGWMRERAARTARTTRQGATPARGGNGEAHHSGRA